MYLFLKRKLLQQPPTENSICPVKYARKLFQLKVETTNVFHHLAKNTPSSMMLAAGGVQPKSNQ